MTFTKNGQFCDSLADPLFVKVNNRSIFQMQ